MVQSPTNGHGTDDERPGAREAQPASESRPNDKGDVGNDADVLPRGSALGRYLVLERLGAGAMGVVYAAYDPELDRKVAIKILRPQAGNGDHDRRRSRLVREAKAVAKLSHPNVVGIFDVGVHDAQVFLAMEYLGGGTLREWMSTKHSWRETVDLFVEIGRGLASAHAEGLIHRDFKPDNVLLDKSGTPKVVDFGLVRMADDLESTGEIDRPSLAESVRGSSSFSGQDSKEVLTRTGALTGTPAYMAPEQFLGRKVDAASDQFAFAVSLFEALYGERPFVGNTIFDLADSVLDGKIRPAPKTADVPGWIRACLVRALHPEPLRRFPGLDDMLAALRNDPVVRRRRRLMIVSAAAISVGLVVGTRHLLVAKHQEIERKIAADIEAADAFESEAARDASSAKELRVRALRAFDDFDREHGEEQWAKSLSLAKSSEIAYENAIQKLEAAASLDSKREIKDRTADVLVAYLKSADLAPAEAKARMRQLAQYDEGGNRARALSAPAGMQVTTSPQGLDLQLEAYDAATYQIVGAPRSLGRTPMSFDLAPGSYLLSFVGDAEHSGFRYPVLLSPGEQLKATISVPKRAAVPEGFVYVPAGRFLFGSADEAIRPVFLETAPLHEVSTDAFLISRDEVTIGDWISFLDDLPARERELRRPQGRKDLVMASFLEIKKVADGSWDILFRESERLYHARQGEPFRYSERDRRTSQDWMRFPVAGISPEDAVAYSEWLSRTGRVPGARLCSEREWERAARGADGREFPHGNRLLRDDANFDLTYGRKSGAYGPDVVGSHPASRSPFGIDDLVGNVWEITASSFDRDQFVARGGSYYQNLRTMLSSNRDPLSAVMRDHTIGLRICADVHQ